MSITKEFVKIVVIKSASLSPCGYQGYKLSAVLNHCPNCWRETSETETASCSHCYSRRSRENVEGVAKMEGLRLDYTCRSQRSIPIPEDNWEEEGWDGRERSNLKSYPSTIQIEGSTNQ